MVSWQTAFLLEKLSLNVNLARLRFGLGIGVVGTAVLLWVIPDFTLRQVLAFTILAIWPMLTWATVFKGGWGSRLLTAGGMALLLQALLGLLLHYLPQSPSRGLLLAGLVVVPLLPLFRPLKPLPAAPQLPDRRLWWLVGGLILLTLLLRWPNLGYKEFQGDEGIIMARAAAMLAGDDTALFNHQKGPIEILLPLLLWGSGEAITEFWARLPFWWGGLLLVGAVVWLGQLWFSLRLGLLAGLLFVLNGFALAFSRIVQYQTFVMLWGLLAIIFADFYGKHGRKRDLWLTAVFLAGGLLAHYDAVLVVPVVGWLLWPRLWPPSRVDWQGWLVGLLLGTGLLGLFYFPFLLNPNFGRTGNYLLSDRLGGSLLSWSGPEVWQMVTFYNSLYYVAGLSLLIVAGIGWGHGRFRRMVAAWLYFAVPLAFYLIIVADPRTHVYTFFPGAAVLAALGLERVSDWLKQTGAGAQRAGQAVWILFIVVTAVYPFLLFIDSDAERQRNWATARPAGYPTTFAEPPLFGLFGFPYQAGWRAVADLPLAWPIASNEEEEITNVYLGPEARTFCPDANTFILAAQVQDAVPFDPTWPETWHLQVEVMVNGRSTMQIYSRKPVDGVQTVEAGEAQWWLRETAVAPADPQPTVPLDIVLGDDQIQLLGYDLDASQAHPGGQLGVTLYWRVLAPFSKTYQVFTHLWSGEVFAQHDSGPECGFAPTTRLEPGALIADNHILPLAESIPPGSYALLAGMYQLEGLIRLSVPDSPDNIIVLTQIDLEDAPSD